MDSAFVESENLSLRFFDRINKINRIDGEGRTKMEINKRIQGFIPNFQDSG